MKKYIIVLAAISLVESCSTVGKFHKLKPSVITQQVKYDTDDPAIWINEAHPEKSLIIGTDKEQDGGLYVFDLDGKIVQNVPNIARPNNVDLRQNIILGDKKVDIVAVTERNANKVRFFTMPGLKPVGEVEVFAGESLRDPMGIAMYHQPRTGKTYIIVGRKTGPSGTYLWQYELKGTPDGIEAVLVRKFGNFSGKKEIESIAVDDALGYVYCSDEMFGVRKYHADPEKGNEEISIFGLKDFKRDIEGISIYPTGKETGYILVSDQQADRFNVYRRENPEAGRIASIPVSTLESDGSEVTAVNLGPKFPKGLFVAMSNGKVFQYYDWRIIEAEILRQSSTKK